MSKGPGKWQQVILKAIASGEWVLVRSLEPDLRYYMDNYGERWLRQAVSDSESLRRAVRKLRAQGVLISSRACNKYKVRKCCYSNNNTYK